MHEDAISEGASRTSVEAARPNFWKSLFAAVSQSTQYDT